MQDFTLSKGKSAIVLAGLFCLYAVYGAVSDFKLPGQAEALEPVDPIVELDPVNIQLLTKTHLFGQPPQVKVVTTKKIAKNIQVKAKPKPKIQQKPNIKPIKINIVVTGLLASADAAYAAAILKVDNKPEKLYKVGEDLGKPEVKLQSVELESVVIDNNGIEQIIAMKRPGLENDKNATNNRSASRSRSNSTRNNNRIPELSPELELPDELELLDESEAQSAYSSALPESADPDLVPSSQQLEQELLLEQMQDEQDEDIRAEFEAEISSAPNFQMPVF